MPVNSPIRNNLEQEHNTDSQQQSATQLVATTLTQHPVTTNTANTTTGNNDTAHQHTWIPHPPAPENGKSTLSFTLPKTPVTMALITNGNKRKAMSSEPALLPPPKELKSGAEDTLFQGDRELWLANRLMDPEIYLTLQASKDSPAPPGARYKTKAAAHRHIAFEFNREKEHAGFMFDEGKIKNKIAKMCQHFKLAHRFRADSPTNLDGNVIRDGNSDKSRSTGSIQQHSDGRGEAERSDVDTGYRLDQGSADVITVTEDINADTGDVDEEEQDESLERGRHCTATRETPAFGSQGTILLQAMSRDKSLFL
ncbi:hypothetical protein K457DRAFT_27437 [Linnemannia elongata AG-77]|uniref:Uncharacterized protein n=1 Tax=Linnemannia elongata AG-77 TaxID=1314771 RepID=A0A197KDJ4_9FUNG|nr:hypothetical protein K457DRAFT_27437 [Linnemannia elongata AG-77]